MTMDEHGWSETFILNHEEAIKDSVKLETLVPKLYKKGLITKSEREELVYVHTPPNERKTKLVTFISKKSKDTPRLLIECLREEGEHRPHSELATLLENDLRTLEHHAPAAPGSSGLPAVLPSNSDFTVPQNPPIPAAPSVATPTHSGPCPGVIYVSGQGVNYIASEQGHSSSVACDMSRSFLHDDGRVLPSPHGVSVTDSLDELQRTSPEYANLVLSLSAELSKHNYTFEYVKNALLAILENAAIPIQLPPNVTDFPTLCLHLRRLKLCHETDTDLLSELFNTMRIEHLKEIVGSYARRMSSEDVMQHRYQSQSRPSQRHFVAFTFHNVSRLSLGQAYEIKHHISELLNMPRHTFSLVGYEPGSIGLAWQVPLEYLKNMQSTIREDREIQVALASYKYPYELVELQVKAGSERLVIFSRSTVVEETAHMEQSPTPRSSQEDMISSTTDEVSSSEYHHPLSTSTKRRFSSSLGEDDHISDDARPSPTKKPNLSIRSSIEDGKGPFKRSMGRKYSESDDLPPPKRPNLHDEPRSAGYEKFGDTSPEKFGSQYIPPKHFCKESSHVDETPRSTLIRTLKGCYKNRAFFRRAAGPAVGKIEFINLALVKKQNVNEDDKEKDKLLKRTLHGLIDDIVKKKEEIVVSKIFSYIADDSRKLVLVEGAPGVGKTMLALKLCSDWGKGAALKEYDVVLLVQLRRFQGLKKVTLEDIIQVHFDEAELARSISKELFKQNDKVLLILEGWDELPPRLRKEGSFFFDIVIGNKLPNASVLVTSRPTVTADLYIYMDERHIEVLGFTPKQIEEYVRTHAKDKAESVLKHLNNFPNLKALAHIPLTLAIICRLASDNIELPPTLTELYNNHICNLLHQNLKRSISLLGVGGLSKLPKEELDVVKSLCKLALQGMEDKNFVFMSDDLRKVGLDPSESFDGFGLLSTPIVAATAGHDLYYQFAHLSIQEFLAAYQIQQLNSEECVQLLKEYRQDKQFQNVWKFLSGITKLKEEEFQRSIISETTSDNRDQMFLIHCLFEAHDKGICQKGAQKLRHSLNINNMSLNTTDCLCAAYTITTAGGDWTVDLRGCNVGADGMSVFKFHFESHLKIPEPERTDFKIKEFNLTHNRITKQAATYLAEILKKNIHVVKVQLASNPLREDGLKELADALSENKTVNAIHFSSCELTPACGEHFARMLRKNSTLKDIYIGFEPLQDEGVCSIASALTENSTLTDLSLTKTDFTKRSLQRLAEVLEHNKSLEVIRFDRDEIGRDGCHIVAKMIAVSKSLVLIDMSKNPIGDEGFEILLDALIARPTGPIKKMGVFGCGITGKGLTKLVDFFRVTEVFEGIQLGCNKLGDKGAELIGKALQANASKSVKQILLESTDISQDAQDRLAEIAESLKSDRKDLDVNYEHHAQVMKQRLMSQD